MATDFAIGSRVRVRQDQEFGPGPWPSEPTGTIVGRDGDVVSRRGVLRVYVVEFDVPQMDADGDGPYVVSQVDHTYLELLD